MLLPLLLELSMLLLTPHLSLLFQLLMLLLPLLLYENQHVKTFSDLCMFGKTFNEK